MAIIGYVDEADLTAYAEARGIVLTRPEGQTLQLALDYLELLPWSGYKTDPEQVLDFPRNGDTEVPADIEQAQLVAAVIYDSGGDPIGAVGPRVLSETVVGAVSVSYSDKGNQTIYYPKLKLIVQPYLGTATGMGGTQFQVRRG